MAVPDILYKYTTAFTTKCILESGKLRWSSPCQFNDTYELQRMPILSPDFNEVGKLYAESITEIIYSKEEHAFGIYTPQTQKMLEVLDVFKRQGVPKDKTLDFIKQNAPKVLYDTKDLLRKDTEARNDGSLRIMCLTENDNNSAMWTHYAEFNTGCMLGFTHIESLSTPFMAAEQVTYTPNAPTVGSALDIILYGVSEELNKRTRLAIYCNKGEDWAYEKEWRAICNRNPGNGERHSDLLFYEQELESLTFGLMVTPEDKKEITELIEKKYPKCKVFDIVTSNGSPVRVQIKG